jgi:protein-disulfide isomerase
MQTSGVARTKKRIPAKRAPAQRQTKRPSGLAVILAFAVAMGAAAVLVLLAVGLRDDGESPPPTTGEAIDFEGIPQDGSVLGSPDARVTLIEYADLQCPACRAYTDAMLPTAVNDYARPGDVKLEFRGLAFLGPDSEKALRLVHAAGVQDRLWHLQEALYRNQGGENSGWVTDELVRVLASGIPGLDADRLFEDAESEAVTALMQEDAQQAEADEVGGTPTLLVQVGEDEPYKLDIGLDPNQLAAALDDALGR